jgi:hypothetical protein
MKFLKNNNKVSMISIKKLAVLGLASALTVGVSSASAEDVKISGWLFYVGVDRDSEEELEFGVLGNSGSQISFDAAQDIGNNLTVAVNFRISSFGSSSGNDVEFDQRSISLSGAFGKIDIGQNLSASAFLDSYDNSPSYWIDPAGWLNKYSATGQSSIAGLGSDLTTGATVRIERLRYDTPTYNGLTGRLQVGDNGSREYAAVYSNHNIIANAFVIDPGNAGTDNTIGFLLGYNAPFGLHGSVNRSVQDRADGGEDEVFGWKLGYQKDKHFVSYSTTEYDDGAADNYERKIVSYVYQAGENFQLYGQYTDEERGSLDDSAIAFGAGIFF